MKRNSALDYTRIILTLIIVLFHFAEAFGLLFYKLFYLPNHTWTWGAVGAFTVMSGYLLRTRYRDSRDIATFYKKRLLTLFPPFYIAFIFAFIIHSIELGSPFYGGHPVKIIFTILGIDSYVGLYGITSYSVVGEWYTGVIIILYALFPLINMLLRKMKFTTLILLLLAFIANTGIRPEQNVPETSMFTCILLFAIGMVMADYSDWIIRKWWLAIVFMVAMVLLIVIPIDVPHIILLNLMSVMLFTILLILFSKTGKNKTASKVTAFLSGISYEVYLIHHFLIFEAVKILPDIKDNVIICIATFVAIVVISGLAAYVIHLLAKKLIVVINRIIFKEKA